MLREIVGDQDIKFKNRKFSISETISRPYIEQEHRKYFYFKHFVT